MKKHRPVKHAHRKAMIAQKKAKGKYSRCHRNKYCYDCPIYCKHCYQ